MAFVDRRQHTADFLSNILFSLPLARPTRKQASLKTIQANLSDIQAIWSYI